MLFECATISSTVSTNTIAAAVSSVSLNLRGAKRFEGRGRSRAGAPINVIVHEERFQRVDRFFEQ